LGQQGRLISKTTLLNCIIKCKKKKKKKKKEKEKETLVIINQQTHIKNNNSNAFIKM